MATTIDTTDVHLGHWINLSYGTIRGSTVTLTKRDGAFLTAAIAIFVSFAGARFWRVVTFVVSLCLTKRAPQDGVYHQRQAVLRNSPDALSTCWTLWRVNWAWRKKKGRVWRRVMPLVVIAFLVGLALAAVGVLSSQISSSMGNEVLLNGKQCGWVDSDNMSPFVQHTIFEPYTSQLHQAAILRAQQCYTTDASTENCPTFVKPGFPLSVITNASCPFQASMCQDNSSNLIVDTGYLNSHFDFGVNAAPSNRILFRSRMHCAPLVLEGYSSLVDATDLSNGNTTVVDYKQMMQYYYGNAFLDQPGNLSYLYPFNQTGVANDLLYPSGYGLDYTLGTNVAYYNNTDANYSSFVAIPELVRPDADTLLLYLSANSIDFSAPVEDPWYSANNGPFFDSGNNSFWLTDNTASVLGCATQIQYCNPNLPLESGCGPLMSLYQLGANFNSTDQSMWQSKEQAALAYEFMSNVNNVGDFYELIGSVGVAVLTSRNSLWSGVQGPLPNNQWQLDMENLQAIYVASIQRQFIEWANGPRYPGLGPYISGPANEWDRIYCHCQMIISTDFTSFSTLGIALAATFGLFFIAISYLLEPLLHWARSKHRLNNYALLEWSMNDTLQLQSAVHEELNLGTWTREVGSVPVTLPNERLGVLDLSDMEHPRFKAPDPSSLWNHAETMEMKADSARGAAKGSTVAKFSKYSLLDRSIEYTSTGNLTVTNPQPHAENEGQGEDQGEEEAVTVAVNAEGYHH